MSAPEPSPTGWRRPIVEAVPRFDVRRDATLAAIVVASILVHAAALLVVLASQWRDAAVRPREIPVEIVQLPPEPAKPLAATAARKPDPAKQQAPAGQEPAKQQAAKEAPKPAQPKTTEAKPQPSKQAPKPAPKQKTAEKAAPPHDTKQAAAKEPQQSPAERLQSLLGPIQGLAAVALPGSAEAGTEAVSYSQLVMSRIAKAKKQGRYPGVPGYATVDFQIGDNGEVTGLQLLRPSGDEALDAEALALVHRGEPYPPPPPGGRRDYVVTLQFREMP